MNDPDYVISVLSAEGEATKKKHDLRVDNVGDGLQIKLGEPHDASIVIERTAKLIRIFVIPGTGCEEVGTIELLDKNKVEEDEARVLFRTAGGKVVYDSTKDSHYDKDED